MNEVEKNERSIESDTSGSIGSDNGSDGSGSGGEFIGSGGSNIGSGGSDDRSGGSDDRSDGSGRGGSGNDRKFYIANDLGGNTIAEKSNDRKSRSERERGRRSIRIERADRSDNPRSDGSDGSDGSGGSEAEKSYKNPVIRLGKGQSKKPKETVDSEKTSNISSMRESKDLISVFLDSIFEIPAMVLKQDFWRLTKEENKTLTNAIVSYLESLPKSKGSKIAAFIAENFPMLNLAMIAFFIVSERVRQSITVANFTKKGKVIKAEFAKQNTDNPSNISTPLDAVYNG